MKKPKPLILSTKVSTKFANRQKLEQLDLFLDEYKRLCQAMVDIQDKMDKPGSFLTEKIHFDTWLSSNMKQCCWKQANSIVKGHRQKQSRRTWQYEDFLRKGWIRKARKLKRVIDATKSDKIMIRNCNPELDQRFVKLDLNGNTSFDGWIKLIRLQPIYGKLKILIPFKKTKHFNNLMEIGKLKPGCRLSRNSIAFNFAIKDDIKPKPIGNTIGIDIGITDLYCLSNGTKSQSQDGWNLDSILDKVTRRVKGSVGFRKACEHRKNHINWSLNQINYKNMQILKCERLKNVRRGKRSSKKLGHWTYTEIIGKLERKCKLEDVLLIKTVPTYTSQRCSVCGWVRKSNRKGKLFTCDRCCFSMDSDVNASRNIVLPLSPIRREERLKNLNRAGFYWYRDNIVVDENRISFASDYLVQEPIVPETQKVTQSKYNYCHRKNSSKSIILPKISTET